MAYIGRKPSFSQVRTAELVVQRGTDISTAGTIAALDVSNISLVRLTAATILQGIAAPSAPADNGKRVTLINANTSDLIVRNESGSATAANRVSTGISRDMRITPGASLTLTYNTASSRWSVESSSAEINIDRLRVASEVVSSGPDISVLNSGNGKSTLLELTSGFGSDVRSIAAGLSGQFVVLVNKTGSLIQVANEDTGATAEDRILTGTGGPISLQNNASLFLAYLTDSSSASRWQVVGGTGSGGGATEQVTQTGIGNLTNFPVGTPLYVDATTGWTAANASAANTAEVAGMLGRSLSANLAEVVMAGEVAGVTASVFTEAVLPARGEVVFLSATSGKLTITEPSVVGQISKPLGVVHNVNGSTSVDIMFFNWRGSVVGGANARTTISLANSATTSVQDVSAYDAGELAGWVFIDGTANTRFYIQAQFAKNGAGTDYNLSYQTTGDTPVAGFSMTVTAAGVIQVTLPSVTGFTSATINYALNAPAVGASLPLAIDGSNVVNSLTNVAAGTAAAPSYSFTGDNNTGMYQVSPDVLGLSTAGVQRVVVDASGNVGIGTASPTNKLQVSGSGSTYMAVNSVNAGSGAGLYMTNSTNSYLIGAGAASGGSGLEFRDVTNSTTRMTIDASGSLLLGSGLSNGYGVAGGIYAPSIYNYTTASAANLFIESGGFFRRSTSSIKYKQDVQNLVHGLSEVLQLRPVTYKGKSQSDGDKVFGGLIAEEVHAAGLTEFVQYAEDGSPDALAYGNMVSLCIKAIQEQQAQIEKQSQALEALKAEVAALKAP